MVRGGSPEGALAAFSRVACPPFVYHARFGTRTGAWNERVSVRPKSSEVGESRASGAKDIPAYERLLGSRLFANAMARFGVAIVLIAGSWIARSALGPGSVDARALSIIGLVVAAYNVVILKLNGRPREWEDAQRALRTRRSLARTAIVLDFFMLTITIWFLGGARSPLLAVYVLHIGIASILLPPRSAVMSAILAALLLTGLIVIEMTGVAIPPSPNGMDPGAGPLAPGFVVVVLCAYLGIFAFIMVTQTQLAETLRRAENMAEKRAHQYESLSRMRRDFLHVALHDVASPMATAELLMRNLHDELCGPLEPRQKDQLQRAMHRVAGMRHLVRDLQILGELETTDLREHSIEIPLAFLLTTVMDDHADAAKANNLSLEIAPSEHVAIVFGVPRLLEESLTNYVDNAIKYTPPGGRIVARVRPGEAPGTFRVEVSDTGVGIAPEDKARLFSEFTRLGRGHPAVKSVPGTGLGLSIVRRIIESHGGRVGVSSEPGKGSTFWLELPACTGKE